MFDQAALDRTFEEIDRMLDRDLDDLEIPPEVEEAARRAIAKLEERKRFPETVEDWAQRLAEDFVRAGEDVF